MNSSILMGLIVGGLFGAGLVLAGLADPDKIIGTLRLKDFHALRTIAVFVLVGMLGTWILNLLGLANFDVKPAVLIPVAIGGLLLGVGFGLTGYCPGTGLACTAAGRFDALITVLGMFLGAGVFILVQPYVMPVLGKYLNYGKASLPDITHVPAGAWVIPIVAVGAIVLFLTRPRKSPSTKNSNANS